MIFSEYGPPLSAAIPVSLAHFAKTTVVQPTSTGRQMAPRPWTLLKYSSRRMPLKVTVLEVPSPVKAITSLSAHIVKAMLARALEQPTSTRQRVMVPVPTSSCRRWSRRRPLRMLTAVTIDDRCWAARPQTTLPVNSQDQPTSIARLAVARTGSLWTK